jgi:hypothetical protein
MDLEITLAGNEWTEKICYMGCVPALIELYDGDSIDSWSLLNVNKTVCEEREGYNTTYYDTPTPIGALPSISF